ncbi:hypothetical protein MIR68_009379 [Amoeboaphelidium protococcarum]|nr:hypothetical protein MIR68_009379 [Amoeboaphelidium protococcarum]
MLYLSKSRFQNVALISCSVSQASRLYNADANIIDISDKIYDFESMKEVILSQVSTSKSLIVVDSIDLFASLHGVYKTYTFLCEFIAQQKLTNKDSAIIALCHRDCMHIKDYQTVSFAFNCKLDVVPIYDFENSEDKRIAALLDSANGNSASRSSKDDNFKLKLRDQSPRYYGIKSVYRKSNGKTYHEESIVTMADQPAQSDTPINIEDAKLFMKEFYDVQDNKGAQQQTQQDPLDGMEVPFNLALTEDQKRERDQVNLAYLDRQDPSLPVPQFPVIEYIPDAADDFDDEDPDF